jgi:hypothetical protein
MTGGLLLDAIFFNPPDAAIGGALAQRVSECRGIARFVHS